MKLSSHCIQLLLAIFIAFPAVKAHAQYPNRPIRIVVGFVAGGTPDVVARLFGQRLSVVLGQPVVIENRTGSGGSIATDFVANAAPDGYTLLLGVDSQFTINPHLYPKMTSPLKSLAPVAPLVSNQFYLAVNPALPVKNFTEFIEFAHKAKTPLAYGSAGSGSQSHLGMEMLKQRAGIDLLHVPYRGAGQSTGATIGGEVQVMLSGSILPQIEAGRLRGLAVTTQTRSSGAPNLPAIADTFPGYEVKIWLGLFTVAGSPVPVIARLRSAVSQVLAEPDTREKLEKLHMQPYSASPDIFSAVIRADFNKYGKLVKELGIKAD